MGLFDFFKKKKETAPTKQAYEKFCPKCGAGVKNDAKVCPNCKYDFNTTGEVISKLQGTVSTNNGTVAYCVEVSTPTNVAREIGTFVKNGITYHSYEKYENGYHMSYDIPEYNQTLAYCTFLKKYPTIQKPSDMRECDYSHYTFSHIGVEIVSDLHKELFDKGFYEESASRDALEKLKVGEIKEIIEKLGFTIKGKKEDLIDGLVSQASEPELKSMLPIVIYRISQFGQSWLTEHELEYEFYTSDTEYESFEAYKRICTKKSIDDIEIEKCMQEIRKDKKDFGRYAYDSLISIYKKRGNTREVVICYLKELLIDVSGALNYDSWKSTGFSRSIIRECNTIYFTPYLLKTFPTLKDYYEPNMIEEVYSLKLPINACSIDDFRDIAEMMLDGTMDESTRQTYINRLSTKLVEIGISKH